MGIQKPSSEQWVIGHMITNQKRGEGIFHNTLEPPLSKKNSPSELVLDMTKIYVR